MEVTGTTHFCDLFVAPDLPAGDVSLRVGITVPSHPSARSVRLHLRADGPDGGVHAREEDLTLPASRRTVSRSRVATTLAIDDPQPWTVDHPQLYRLHAVLTEGERTLDAASREFGMRTIDIDGIHIRLNGQPIYLMGAMDPQDIPDKNIYLPDYHAPTDDEIRNEVLLAKRMGFNCIRKHHQIDDHRYLRWADRLGLLVYGQPPCYRRITDASVRRWAPPGRGGGCAGTAAIPPCSCGRCSTPHRALRPCPRPTTSAPSTKSAATTPEERAEIVRVAHDLVKRLDPTRPVMDTAGGEFYRSEVALVDALRLLRAAVLPARARALPRPARRPGSAVSPAHRARSRTWIPSRSWSASWAATSTSRTWTGSGGSGAGARRGRSCARPAWAGAPWASGWPTATRSGSAPGVWTKCTAASPAWPNGTTGRRSRTSRTRSSRFRKGPDVTGYVITMFSNMGPYVHGLVDYDLSLRPFHGELARLNSPDLLIVDWEELNHWPGRTVRAKLLLSLTTAPARSPAARYAGGSTASTRTAR